jgi:hypothetical protein
MLLYELKDLLHWSMEGLLPNAEEHLLCATMPHAHQKTHSRISHTKKVMLSESRTKQVTDVQVTWLS